MWLSGSFVTLQIQINRYPVTPAYFLFFPIYHFNTWTLHRLNWSTALHYRKLSEAHVGPSTRWGTWSRALLVRSWAVIQPSAAPLPAAGDGRPVRDDESAPVGSSTHPHLGFSRKERGASPSPRHCSLKYSSCSQRHKMIINMQGDLFQIT